MSASLSLAIVLVAKCPAFNTDFGRALFNVVLDVTPVFPLGDEVSRGGLARSGAGDEREEAVLERLEEATLALAFETVVPPAVAALTTATGGFATRGPRTIRGPRGPRTPPTLPSRDPAR